MKTKLCPITRQSRRVETPIAYSGPLSDCLRRAGIEPETPESRRFVVQFYRGQMRGWAGRWRDAAVIAMLCREPESRIAEQALWFAKHYRDCAAGLARKIGGAR